MRDAGVGAARHHRLAENALIDAGTSHLGSASHDAPNSPYRAMKKAATWRGRVAGAVARDLVAAAAAAAARTRARADGSESGGKPETKKQRMQASARVKQHEREPNAWERDVAAQAALVAARLRARADGSGSGGDEHAKALRRDALERLRLQREALEAERIGGRRAARIAIVGAGPAGLWLAVLLARKHATLTLTGNAVKITRNSHAPQIDVYERRLPAAEAGAAVRSADEANKYDHSSDNSEATSKALHGSRNIILAITQQTQDLLNRHLCGTASSHSHHAFAPTSRIGDIERILAAEFERYCAAGFGQLTYGAVVGDPDEFHSARRGGYDVVFVASGKKGVPDEWRIARGLESIVEGTAAAILVQVR